VAQHLLENILYALVLVEFARARDGLLEEVYGDVAIVSDV
jgi:hypothetical protein